MSRKAKWVVAEVEEKSAVRLASELDVPLPLGRLLVQRGLADSEAAELFLRPRLSHFEDPFKLPDMQTAVERIWTAIEEGQKITVHGDYDVDGITATALMMKVLKALGADANPFIPHRIDDGYGLGVDNIDQCRREHRTELMVTVDCGTGDVEAARHAREAGVDLVVTDHHEISGDVAPALAVVNPKCCSDAGSARNLAGVGVAFKLCHALLKYGRESGKEGAQIDLRPFIDIVALGTVADIVPLVGENRTLVRYGLQLLEQTENVGLQALLDCSKITPPYRTYHLAFQLAPRLNAAGRIGSAMRGLELLLTEDRERAAAIAGELDEENRERQNIEKRVVKACENQMEDVFDPARDYAIVAAGEGWHRGVVGIAASRLVKEYYRPTFVISLEENGLGHGSGRSIEGFDLVGALESCEEVLDEFGGHEMAAGISLQNDKIEEFRTALNAVAAKKLEADDLVPRQRVDAWVDLEDVGEALFEAQNMLAPFGASNPTPVWAVSDARFMSEPREVGNGHLKARIGIGNTEREAIGFNMWGRGLPQGPMDVAFKLERNEYRGRVSYQLNLCDIRSADGPRN